MKAWLLDRLGVRDEACCPAHVPVVASFGEQHWDQARPLVEQTVSLSDEETERGKARLVS